MGPKIEKKERRPNRLAWQKLVVSKPTSPRRGKNGASLASPCQSSKGTSMGREDSNLMEEQNKIKLSNNGKNNVRKKENKNRK